jgi:N-methylhydantoinase B
MTARKTSDGGTFIATPLAMAAGSLAAKGVIFGVGRRKGRSYANQLVLGSQGGPATAYADGWPTYQRPVSDALLYHDSVEIDEERYPLLVCERRLLPRAGGHGRRCGGQASRVALEPRFDDITSSYAIKGAKNPPRGVRGGHDAQPGSARLLDVDGSELLVPQISTIKLRAGQRLISTTTGAGGMETP